MAARKSGSGDDGRLHIPAIQLEQMTVTIIGATPLLCDRITEEALDEIEKKQTGAAKGPREFRKPGEEWFSKLYVMDAAAERYGFPAAGIKKALVTAGGRFADAVQTELKGMLSIPETLVEIKGCKPQKRRDGGRLQGKVLTPIYRPMFQQWRMEVPVVYNAAKISEEQILELFQHAGFGVGIGAWRVEKNGTFGQFKIEKVS